MRPGETVLVGRHPVARYRLGADPGLRRSTARHEPYAADNIERYVGGEMDAVRLGGVLPYLVHARSLVEPSHLVAALSAECLGSEHVASDHRRRQL